MTPFETKQIFFCETGICCVLTKLHFVFKAMGFCVVRNGILLNLTVGQLWPFSGLRPKKDINNVKEKKKHSETLSDEYSNLIYFSCNIPDKNNINQI